MVSVDLHYYFYSNKKNPKYSEFKTINWELKTSEKESRIHDRNNILSFPDYFFICTRLHIIIAVV